MLLEDEATILRLLLDTGGEVHRVGFQARSRLDQLVSRGLVERIDCTCCPGGFRVSEAGRTALAAHG